MKADQDSVPFIDRARFDDLVGKLHTKISLLAAGKPLVPWSEPTEEQILKWIRRGAEHLPLIYQEKYAEPLIRNLRSVITRSSARRHSSEGPKDIEQTHKRNMEILAGAIYCHMESHAVPPDVVKALHCFLAVISNTYRSFLPTKRKYENGCPMLQPGFYPPLATFRSGKAEVPSMLTRDQIQKATGGSVGVVVLPTIYKDHPLLWTAIAHEVGGHEIMNAMPGLLPELQKGVRQLFNVKSLTSVYSGKELDEEQLIGLLWQYWTEETLSDVCGVLNLGPAYGISLTVYQAALHRAFANKYGSPAATPLRLWSGEPPDLARYLDPDAELPELDSHPVDILKLNVMIGVVENLTWLSKEHKTGYVALLERLAQICAGSQEDIHVCGLVQAGPDLWIKVNTYNSKPLNLGLMQAAARRVGAYMATVDLAALNGYSLQKLESWDEIDEETAQAVARALNKKNDVSNLGDDAQLLAGATLAFVANPKEYEYQTSALMEALEDSYARDYFWGLSRLHFLVDYPPPNVVAELAQEVSELASQRRVRQRSTQGAAAKPSDKESTLKGKAQFVPIINPKDKRAEPDSPKGKGTRIVPPRRLPRFLGKKPGESHDEQG
jgi:hypothetical protein